MRKVIFVGISAFAFVAFAMSAQAEGDCSGMLQTVATPKPVITVDSATTTQPTTTKSGG